MAALSLIMGATAQAQMTKREVDEAALDEVNRVTAMMKEMGERGENLGTDPRRIMEYCQETLPKLDDAFRVLMTYSSPEQQQQIQNFYMLTRQHILDLLVKAQLALSQAQ